MDDTAIERPTEEQMVRMCNVLSECFYDAMNAKSPAVRQNAMGLMKECREWFKLRHIALAVDGNGHYRFSVERG